MLELSPGILICSRYKSGIIEGSYMKCLPTIKGSTWWPGKALLTLHTFWNWVRKWLQTLHGCKKSLFRSSKYMQTNGKREKLMKPVKDNFFLLVASQSSCRTRIIKHSALLYLSCTMGPSSEKHPSSCLSWLPCSNAVSGCWWHWTNCQAYI